MRRKWVLDTDSWPAATPDSPSNTDLLAMMAGERSRARAMAEQTEMQRFTDAMNPAIREAADRLLEQSRSIPAPCGCTPDAYCDKHCRARITSGRDKDGDLAWYARCNGIRKEGRCGAAYGDLNRVHDWATDHITYHREQAGGVS